MISVLSADAEIERENIHVQMMEGRIQKAKEGKQESKNRFHKNKESHDVKTAPCIDGTRDILSVNERGNLGFHKELKKGVEANNRVQKSSLNPHYKLNLNTKAKVRITPLGGLGEIGGNMMVMETENSAIIIDVGMSFPEENMHGVDILIPDFSYIHAIKEKIVGIIITHAHEDHIGAVPYLFKQLQFPLYGTPLALGMIGNKFDEVSFNQALLESGNVPFMIVERHIDEYIANQ